METRNSRLPNLYCFEKLDDVNVDHIEGDAIILIGEECSTTQVPPQKYVGGVYPAYERHTYHTTAYFVKNNQFVLDDYSLAEKTAPVTLSEYHWNSMRKKRQENGRVMLQDKPFKAKERLEDKIADLARDQHFPYIHVTLYLSKDGKSLDLTSIKGPVAQNEYIHPLLREYLQKRDNPNYDILTLLYKLKSSPDFERSISFYQEGGTPLGFGMVEGGAHQVSLNEMISKVRKANGKAVTLPEKQRLITQYFKIQCEAYRLHSERQECGESSAFEDELNNNGELIKLEKAIQRHVKANEIHGLINDAFDSLYPDNEVDKKEGLHFQQKANNLIVMKMRQQYQSIESKAFWYTALCCLLIVTIPFVSLIKKAFIDSIFKKAPLKILNFDKVRCTTYASSLKILRDSNESKAQASKDPTLTKKDFFNKRGELRKFFMTENNFRGMVISAWGATTEQDDRLGYRTFRRLLNEASEVLSAGLNEAAQEVQLRVYKVYEFVCKGLKKKPLSMELLLKENQHDTILEDINTVKENLTSYYYEPLQRQSEMNIQEIIGYSPR